MEKHPKALAPFLVGVLAQRSDCLVGFVISPRRKTQKKIFPLIYHELETMLAAEAIVPSLS